ncbi:DUF423 domain-containing protein [Rodentibacter haemolyticus]|uniref:DUF423 domain-containing protein n=1 Tax=Rodentibacter haemolyticus TaxID=2778911 RepID=A0ABX6UXT5_9PAST|nr:DUF423 domain-containing protein [Rodentibacter haemolyticus]QPB42920.1 DUF423 domain-containing protein [Rodentibacter haemolyticus]
MKNKWLSVASLSGFLCVGIGAFAAHRLGQILEPKALAWIDTAIKYQMFHTLAIMGIGIVQITREQFTLNNALNFAACSWAFGMLLFCGSLYSLALGAGKLMVWLTPIGGVLFLIGWLCLAYGSFKCKSV